MVILMLQLFQYSDLLGINAMVGQKWLQHQVPVRASM